MYAFSESISILNSEIHKYGKLKVRAMLKRCGYSLAEIFALVPIKRRRKA